MSTLTEAEKRKLLRERRAAKVKDGSSRLNKITGDYSIPSVTTTPVLERKDDISELNKQFSNQKKKSNRISQAFHDDPEVEDISNFTQDTKVNQEEADEFQRALQEILASQQQQHLHDNVSDSSTNPFAGNDGQFDFLQQMLGGANSTDGSTGGGALGDLLKGFGGINGHHGTAGLDGETSNGSDYVYKQELLAYNKEINDQYKALSMLTRFIIVGTMALIFHSEDNLVLNSLECLVPNIGGSLFLQIFISFEVIATTVYALRLFRLNPTEYNYDFKILEYLDYVPDAYLSQGMKSNIKLMMRYLELGKLILFDFASVIVIGVLLKVIFG